MKHVKVASNIAIVLIVLGCLVVLTISVYPGALDDLLFAAILLLFLAMPIVVIAMLIVVIVALVTLIVFARRGTMKGVTIPWRRVAIIATVLFGTYVLLKFYVPRRIAFAVSRAAFQQLVLQAPKSDRQRTPLNRRLGVYRVDEYATDPRGGVYFRVYSGGDGIGPDRMSYGFTYRPNSKGTPFGAAHYRVFGLGNDWYWFRASDDWY
jgi:hypothetical protein